MPRTAFLKKPAKLNLTVEEELKKEAHVYASGTKISLSQEFADYIGPKIEADKRANPARYRALQFVQPAILNSLSSAAVEEQHLPEEMHPEEERQPAPPSLSPAAVG